MIIISENPLVTSPEKEPRVPKTPKPRGRPLSSKGEAIQAFINQTVQEAEEHELNQDRCKLCCQKIVKDEPYLQDIIKVDKYKSLFSSISKIVSGISFVVTQPNEILVF